MIAGLLLSLVALAAYSIFVYGAPPLAGLGAVLGCLLMLAVWLGHLWAREWRESRR